MTPDKIKIGLFQYINEGTPLKNLRGIFIGKKKKKRKAGKARQRKEKKWKIKGYPKK